jgi:hypothetical protein
MHHHRFVLAWCGLAALSVTLVGCSGPRGGNDTSETAQRLKQLRLHYVNYMAQHQGRPPANEKEFQDYVSKLPPAQQGAGPAGNATAVLISPRDNQPFVVNWGFNPQAPIRPRSGPPPATQGGSPPKLLEPVLAYERTGQDGKRYVLYASGRIEEVDPATARELKLQ